MFNDALAFNGDISPWNVSAVTDMSHMFGNTGTFNQDLSSWNVSQVTDMGGMFNDARAFNQDLSSWNVSAVTGMAGMFNDARAFNQDLSSWNVSAVTGMNGMFNGARAFNGDISSWNVSAVTNMVGMFRGADSFNRPLNDWDVSGVTDMTDMFRGADSFNRPLNDWNVSAVYAMGGMFRNATSFDQSLDDWDVSTATSMDAMFRGADSFDQNLGRWYVTLDNTAIDRADVPGVIGSISAQNMPLKNHDPAYGIGAGGDSGLFEIVNGNELSMTSAETKSAYAVNVTASGDTVFEDGNNWRVVTIKVDDAGAFITTWTTDSASQTVTIPVGDSTASYNVDWGDGSADTGVSGNQTHTYGAADTYTVSISGGFERIHLGGGTAANAALLASVEQWGNASWTSMEGAFAGTSNMAYNATDVPDLSKVTDTSDMFRASSSFNGDLSDWDVSAVTDMGGMFREAGAFNQPLSSWNVSQVTDTSDMFRGASSFNGDVSSWNVSQVTDTSDMFRGASSFNGDVSSWDVSQVTDTSDMFRGASSFNGDVSSWDVSAVTNMTNLFAYSPFNQNVSAWNVSAVTDMSGMFEAATSFNQDVSAWNVSQVAYMSDMFLDAEVFDQNLGRWYVTLDNTAIDRADVPGVIGSISAQNTNLDGHNPVYGIGAGGDSGLFEIVNGNELNMTSAGAKSAYAVNVTASGGTVFEDGNNWRAVTIKVDAAASQGSAFVTTWTTASASQDITIPVGDSTSPYDVDWGDGSTETGISGDQAHTYVTAGTYTVRISGDFERIHLDDGTTANAKLLASIEQWGIIRWDSMEGAFQGASNMVYNATDAPDLSGVTDTSDMFSGASAFNGNLSSWDVSQVTDMSSMFSGASAFNGNLSSWDVSQVTDISYMFNTARIFNQPLDSWNVSQVTDMSGMFSLASAFNGNLSSWDVSQVTDMSGMFNGAQAFRQPLSSWDVSQVTDMSSMFNTARAFNQPLSSWNVSQVTDMSGMFNTAYAFNQPLSSWNVSQVADMSGMFSLATNFNQPLSSWNVSQVADMSGMFSYTTFFNQPLSSWNVSQVADMSGMFEGASFNQLLDSWDVSKVTDMSSMFSGAFSFNQPLSSWDVSKVTDMSDMFNRARAFDQNLGRWYVTLNNTTIDRADVPGVVGSISAQNTPLDAHNPIHETGAGGDSDLFEIVSGNELNMTSVGTKSAYAVNVTASGDTVFEDGNNWRMVDVTVTGQGNTAPVLGSIGPKTVAELESLTFVAAATDHESDSLTFSLGSGHPADASIDPDTGAFSWTPAEDQDGTHTVTVQVSDGNGGNDSEDVTVTVNEANVAPSITDPGSKTVTELQSLTFTVEASDDDVISGAPDTLTFSLAGAPPAGASIDPDTGAFSWTPAEDQDGTHTVTVRARDYTGAIDSVAIQVTVTEVNVIPVLDPIGPKSASVLEPLAFTATASDADIINGAPDTLEFSLASGHPVGASIDPATGAFSWTPAANQTGSHTVTVTVTDDAGEADSEDVVVTVGASNVNPVLNPIGPKTVTELESLAFTATATDDDGDTLTFSLAGTPPTGASINSATGAFSWTPTERQDGNHTVTVLVSDGNGGSDSEGVTVTVAEANVAPVLDAIGPKSVNRLGTLSFTATASDDDVINGAPDTLEFSLASGHPEGASIDSATGTFSWMLTAGQVGQHTVTVTVTDGSGAADSEAVKMTVTEGGANIAPVLDSIGPQSVNELDTLEFTATASDDDGDALKFSLVGSMPDGAAITPDGAFSWTPDQSQDGTHFITVAVSDGRGGTDGEAVTVTVRDIAPLPISALASSSAITLTLSEVVTSSGTGPNGFSVETGGDPVSVDSITGNGTKSLVLGLNGTVPHGAALYYDFPTGDVQDETGKALESFGDLTVLFPSESRPAAQPPAITIGSQGHPQAKDKMPEGPLPPVPANGQSEFPLVIRANSTLSSQGILSKSHGEILNVTGGNGYALHSPVSTVVPTNVTAGQPLTISVTIRDPTPISYFAIYLHLSGDSISHLQSDAQVIWDSGEVHVIDSNGLMQDVAVTVSGDPDDPAKKTATIAVTFSEGMGDTNMVIRTWNVAGQLAEMRIFDAIAVIAPEAGPAVVDPEPTEMISAVYPEPTADNDSAGRSLLAIRMWSGFEPESIFDADLLDLLGLDYPGADIPNWVMTELGPLAAKGDVTVDEFKTALEYVLERA